MKYTIGIDYGTNSVRALVVNCANGDEIATHVVDYPSGREGILLDKNDPNLARQNPADYLFGLEASVCGALKKAKKAKGFSTEQVVGIGVDSTGSSPIPVTEKNIPLALDKKWKNNLAAQCWLWKDHTSFKEAALITKIAAEHRPQFIAKCGNTYSSEWWWSKILHCLNTAPEVFDAAYSWVELCDFIPSVLAGVTDPLKVKRSICAAGHKAFYNDEWGGLPDKNFLNLLDPKLGSLKDRLYYKAYDASGSAGMLCGEWAEKLGLPEGIAIAIGQFDVHYGAIGSGIKEGTLVKVIGTSTCDCVVVDNSKKLKDIPGICGIVNGSILPGYYGIEAGQSAVGDIFKWFVEGVCEGSPNLHQKLALEAESLSPGQSGLLALDWNNGNRTILVDPLLSGLLVGQTLHTTRAEIYRSLIEATAFGARMIIERIKEYGVQIDRIVCCGGIAEKNPLLMQIYADVTGCEMHVAKSTQACALGSAISAAVLAQAHRNFDIAKDVMTSCKDLTYIPDPTNVKIYNDLFSLYKNLHNSFGGPNKAADLTQVMKELIKIKGEANHAKSAEIGSVVHNRESTPVRGKGSEGSSGKLKNNRLEN